MKVSDPSGAPFNPNPSGLSEIHACAVHVQILTEFKCQVRMTAPDLRAQVCPLPLLVDAETQFRGRKSVCKSFDNRTPAVWFSLFRDLALNSHMTQSSCWCELDGLCAWRTIRMHNMSERESCLGMLAPPGNSQLYCSLLPTFISPIATHNNLHPENHPSFPPRCGLRLVVWSQHGRIRLADSARGTWALKRQTAVQSRHAEDNRCFISHGAGWHHELLTSHDQHAIGQ